MLVILFSFEYRGLCSVSAKERCGVLTIILLLKYRNHRCVIRVEFLRAVEADTMVENHQRMRILIQKADVLSAFCILHHCRFSNIIVKPNRLTMVRPDQ